MKKTFVLVALVSLFSSCIKEMNNDAVQMAETLKVSLDPSTKVHLNGDVQTVWNEGDLLSVYNYNDANECWKFEGKTGDRSGIISRNETVAAGAALDKIVAVYPYNSDYVLSSADKTVSAVIPATQHYLADSYGLGDNLMVSAGTSDGLVLKNVYGWLKLDFTGQTNVRKIVLYANDGKQLNGSAVINYETLETAFVSSTSEESASIVLDCGEAGVALDPSSPTSFYISLVPQTFSEGFTVEVIGTDGGKFTKTTSKEVVISRNGVKKFDELAVETEKVDLAVTADIKISYNEITAQLSAPGAESIYYSFLSSSAAGKCDTDEERIEHLLEDGQTGSASGVTAKATDFLKVKPETKYFLFAAPVDAAGNFGKVLVSECKTNAISYNDLKVELSVALNSPEEVVINISTTGGETVDYLYWVGKTTENTWKSTNYLGGTAKNAQKYMALNPTARYFTNTASNYPITDGTITIAAPTPGAEYAVVAMAKDAEGVYSEATALIFTVYESFIGTIVGKDDPKWESAKPTIDWIVGRFAPAIGMMAGTYAFNITLPEGYVYYVLTATDSYFVDHNTGISLSLEDKILEIIEWTDRARDYPVLVDEALYAEKGHPYGHEFYHAKHGTPKFGNAVVWPSREYHDQVCDCLESEYIEETYQYGFDGPVTYKRYKEITVNEGKPIEFVQSMAIGSKQEVIDRVYVVCQDQDGNCYEPYEWDVPLEYFQNAQVGD